MLYKEWQSTKFKFYILLAGFCLLIFATISPNAYRYGSAYNRWANLSVFVMLLGGILCGADLVADEKDKGTLNFLLSRPISRTHIYLSKFCVNFGSLAIAFLIPDFFVFLTNPRSFYFNLGLLLGSSTMIMLVGAISLGIASIISIFSANTIRAISFSVLAVVIIVPSLGFLNAALHLQLDLYIFGYGLVGLLISGGLATTIFLVAGLYAFNHKKF